MSRIDGPLKVTGRAGYGADNNLPGMVHGYIVLSTIAHGEGEAVLDGKTAKVTPNGGRRVHAVRPPRTSPGAHLDLR